MGSLGKLFTFKRHFNAVHDCLGITRCCLQFLDRDGGLGP